MFTKSNIIIVFFSLVFLASICLLSFHNAKKAINQKKEKVSAISVSNNNEKGVSVSVEDEIKSSIEKTVPDVIVDEVKKTFEVMDFGNGVRYFPFTGARFGEKLSEFIGSNTNLEFVAFAGDVVQRNQEYVRTCDYGATIGYFVIFREKK
jgi:hypothetical protein